VAVLPRAQPLLPPPAKWFHSSPAFLGFRETGAARAGARPEFAADEGWNYEEERKPAGVRAPAGAGAKVGGGAKEEGLEIAKLGISPEIVSKLAGKGITKLFPIQVRGSDWQPLFSLPDVIVRRLLALLSYFLILIDCCTISCFSM
jgi:hypothetical protein